jgi:pyruvate decarboxylase
MGAVTPSADVKNAIENSDLVLHIGEFPSDTNTGGWTYGIARANLIKLHPKYVSIGETTWNSISFVPIVQNLQYRIKSEDSVFRHAQLCKPVSQQLLSYARVSV